MFMRLVLLQSLTLSLPAWWWLTLNQLLCFKTHLIFVNSKCLLLQFNFSFWTLLIAKYRWMVWTCQLWLSFNSILILPHFSGNVFGGMAKIILRSWLKDVLVLIVVIHFDVSALIWLISLLLLILRSLLLLHRLSSLSIFTYKGSALVAVSWYLAS